MTAAAHWSVLVNILGADRETHLYGLADLEEPFWSASKWYVRGRAAVGLVSNDGIWFTGYAMSQTAPLECLDLLASVHGQLPPGSWITGPTGLFERMVQIRPTTPKGPHWRMILDETPPEPDAVVTSLDGRHLEALEELHSTDPASVFFQPAMLEAGHFVGAWDGDTLIASAGTHVASDRFGVAAIGAVITRPSHRGLGWGRVVVASLARVLARRYRTVGLNVAADNASAVGLYDAMGFRRAFSYEEVQVH